MRTISVTMNVSLDGVVQGLARPDEDTRGGFVHGGWGNRSQDEALAREMAKGMNRPGDLLLGRRTWEDFAQVWGTRNDNPYSERMNGVVKHVVSRGAVDTGGWANSVLLQGEAAETVAALKITDGPDLAIIGSAALVRSLHPVGLIDRYALVIHPVTLGSGARMFEGPAPLTHYTLTPSVTTPKGVIIAQYDRVPDEQVQP